MTTKETIVSSAPAMARKMRTRHPARMPLGPRKTVFGGGSRVVSAGVGGGRISGFDIACLSGTSDHCTRRSGSRFLRPSLCSGFGMTGSEVRSRKSKSPPCLRKKREDKGGAPSRARTLFSAQPLGILVGAVEGVGGFVEFVFTFFRGCVRFGEERCYFRGRHRLESAGCF